MLDLESLTSAATSVAAAIQSEHAVSGEDRAAGGPDQGEEGAGDQAEAGAAAASGGGSSPSGPLSRSSTPPPGQLGGASFSSASHASTSAPGTDASGSARVSLRARTARRAWMGLGRSGGAAGAHGTASQQQQQQDARRRAFVAAALRRCITKLEGRDTWDVPALTSSATARAGQTPVPSQGQPGQQGAGQPAGSQQQAPASLSVPQQVDLLIKQATSPDNLCQMYEGWMPWI
jgi:hypothetical protein